MKNKAHNEELLKVAKEKAKSTPLTPISKDEQKVFIRYFQLQKFAAEQRKAKPHIKLRSLRRLLVRKFRNKGVNMREAMQIIPRNYTPIPLKAKEL